MDLDTSLSPEQVQRIVNDPAAAPEIVASPRIDDVATRRAARL